MSDPANTSRQNAAGASARKTKRRRSILIIIGIIAVAVIMGLTQAFRIYRYIFAPNTDLHGERFAWVYIRNSSSFDAVKDSLYKHGYIINKRSFEWVAK